MESFVEKEDEFIKQVMQNCYYLRLDIDLNNSIKEQFTTSKSKIFFSLTCSAIYQSSFGVNCQLLEISALS